MVRRPPKSAARAISALAAAIVWTVGPWTPAALCAIQAIAHQSVDVAMPNCHGHSESGAAAGQRSSHDCCKNVLDSCCLSAPSTNGTPSVSAGVDAPQLAVSQLLVVQPLAMHRLSISAIARPPDPRSSLPPPVLRL